MLAGAPGRRLLLETYHDASNLGLVPMYAFCTYMCAFVKVKQEQNNKILKVNNELPTTMCNIRLL